MFQVTSIFTSSECIMKLFNGVRLQITQKTKEWVMANVGLTRPLTDCIPSQRKWLPLSEPQSAHKANVNEPINPSNYLPDYTLQ